MAQPALNMTFGIELEFICVYPPHVFNDLVDDVDDYCEYRTGAGVCAGQAIYLKLAKRNIPVAGYEALEEEIELGAPSYTRWLVKEDASLYLSHEEEQIVPNGWVIEPVEIASRKLMLTNDSAAEIKVVLEEIFALESMGCRMLTNYTTGLHVHIGNDRQRIPLKTAKRVFQFGTIFAEVMDMLHSYPRVHPLENESRCYLPPGYFHKRNGHNAATTNVFDWLASIERVEDYADLASLFVTGKGRKATCGHSSAYNFDNLDTSGGLEESDITGTIEFRQHRGTLDYNTIIAWIALTSQIVTFCHTASDTDFFALLVYGVNPLTTIRDLCSGIGLADIFTSHFTGEQDLPSELPSTSTPFSARLYRDRMYRSTFDALDEMNDHQSGEYVDAENVGLAIQHKYERGMYGVDGAVDTLSYPVSAIEAYHRQTVAFVEVNYGDLSDVQKASKAREHLLMYLGRLYAGDIVDQDQGQALTCIFGRSGNAVRFDM